MISKELQERIRQLHKKPIGIVTHWLCGRCKVKMLKHNEHEGRYWVKCPKCGGIG